MWEKIKYLNGSSVTSLLRGVFLATVITIGVGCSNPSDGSGSSGTSSLLSLAQKITAGTTYGAASDSFGYSVAISDDTAIVGAFGDDTGSAYIFTRSGTNWSLLQKITPSDGATDDYFGYSVAISDDTAIVGAYRDENLTGSAYIFTKSGTTWSQTQKITASDFASADRFGYSVAISGDTAIVGAYGDESSTGSAYIFTKSGTSWSQSQKITVSDGATGDYFGYSVAISDDVAIVGAPGDESSTGSAYIFTKSGTTWSQAQKIITSDGATGDYFGYSVAISDDTAIVGAYGDESSKGSAYIFTKSGTSWSQSQKITISDGVDKDYFGNSVAISGDTAIVGAYGDESKTGSAYIFTKSGTTWDQTQIITASDGTTYDYFGYSVAISGDTAIFGAYGDDDDGLSRSGSAYIYSK